MEYAEGTYCKFFGAFAKVYTLADQKGNVFYVGCCLRDLDERLKSHFVEAKCNMLNSNLIKNEIIRSLDYNVIITEIDRKWVTNIKLSWALGRARKLEFGWIEHYRTLGYELCNKIPKPAPKQFTGGCTKEKSLM